MSENFGEKEEGSVSYSEPLARLLFEKRCYGRFVLLLIPPVSKYPLGLGRVLWL